MVCTLHVFEMTLWSGDRPVWSLGKFGFAKEID